MIPPREVSTKSKADPGGVATKNAFHRDVALKTQDTYTQITFEGSPLERVEKS